MKRLLLSVLGCVACGLATSRLFSADAGVAPAAAAAGELERQRELAAAETRPPDFLEQIVDLLLEAFNVPASGNTTSHYVIAGVFLVGAIVLRRVLTTFIFRQLNRIAARTATTLDDKLFVAVEPPVATLVLLIGIFAALKVLKLPTLDRGLAYGSTVAFTLLVFWALLRALSALLDHAQHIAEHRQMSVAAFMPWIKRTLATIFVIFGVLMLAQSFGVDVKAFLAGLGIGGLAFALAAQDTLANVFGSVVVAIDQPFKIGEAVKIGANEGVVEDMGLRSTKLRTPGRNLIIIPNKLVAAEPIVNNSRFIQRRVEQVIGLTYSTSPEEMEAVVAEIRRIIESEAEVETSSVHVFFRDYSASSLDVWLAYNVSNPDFGKHMALRQRINLAIMRAIEARRLAFAFPTQTIEIVRPGPAKNPERAA